MADESYDPARVERLIEMLRALAARIAALDAEGRILVEAPELMRRLGDIRSELFRYEVRQTFDSPEVARNREIVEEAALGWTPDADGDGEEPWQSDAAR